MQSLTNEIEAVANQLIFQFVEETAGGGFSQKTGTGILVSQGHEKQLDYCRWGRIMSMGPDVKTEDFNVGDIVLIDSLKWTNMFMVEDDGNKYWVTTDDSILATADPDDLPAEIKNFVV